MSETATPRQIETRENDETFLQTLLNRMSPTPDPALVLKVALRFAAAHAKALSPELILTGLRARGAQKAPDRDNSNLKIDGSGFATPSFPETTMSSNHRRNGYRGSA
jgi:hypothetical protein